MEKKIKIKNMIILHILLLLYSLCGVFSKLAAGYKFFNLKFIILYVLEMSMLLIYAIGWQQVLKRLSLTIAFSNKGITVLWSLVWGIFFFDEPISTSKIVGASLVIIGIIIYSDGEHTE